MVRSLPGISSFVSLILYQHLYHCFTMSLKFSLTPTSTGNVYQSSYNAIEAYTTGTFDMTALPESNPFHSLWSDHRAELASPLYERVIDAFVALAEGSAIWKDDLKPQRVTRKSGARMGEVPQVITAKKGEMKQLLSQHPPDIIVVNGVTGVYSFHCRRPYFWQYICISGEYVDLWKNTNESDVEEKLALTALLKTAIDHELAHWVFSLVSIVLSRSKCHSPSIENWTRFRKSLGCGSNQESR